MVLKKKEKVEYKDVIELIEKTCEREHVYEVFTDFVKMFAISISNAVDKTQYDKREEVYLSIAKKYKKEQLNNCALFMAYVTSLLSAKEEDVLGKLYMELGLASKAKAQEFTPTDISRVMSRLVFSEEEINRCIEDKGYATINDASCGGGSTIIQALNEIKLQGFNYQKQVLVFAEDLDPIAVHMAYIQLSLLGVPAIVKEQNTLTLEVKNVWFTPMFVLGGWERKLRSKKVNIENGQYTMNL